MFLSDFNYFGEEEEDVAREHKRRVRVQVSVRYRLRDTTDPFDVSVKLFMGRYRLPQHLVFELTEMIRPYAERDGHASPHGSGPTHVSPTKRKQHRSLVFR